ncbi:hypothetical protein ACH5RR_010834 [Cinchona calisaya]|uniref:H15 domain-containing protein n=1 Tax=Cinchona calisaya TaxID=153742 RepID=A0ABD3AK11_9GENT
MAIPRKNPPRKAANASSTLHPPYFQMLSEAITSLKDRSGSSQPAIAKFVEGEYRKSLPPNFKKVLSIQLKKFVKSEKLIKIKNSYKVSPSEKGKLVAKSAKKSLGAPRKNVTDNKRKANEKARKMKRLSEVKTPETLKRKSSVLVATNVKGSVTGAKMKRLSQVKTPEALKVSVKMNKLASNSTTTTKSSSRPVSKKARK